MLSLRSVAKILVAHGIYLDDPELAVFVAENVSYAGCSRRALRDWLGY